jgi:hypothetical protein
MKRVLKSIVALVLIAVLVTVGVLLGPRLYALLFGGANSTWVSERFSEELTAKRELIVLEKTITGQENVSTDAWLIGTVQEVIIPYSFTAGFSVDLSMASVQYSEENNTIQVFIPAPEVNYYKLTVDEDSVKKYDFLYPLTSERYTEMKQEMEQKLYDEVVNDPDLKESAWAEAVSQTETLYRAAMDASGATAAFAVEVLEASPQE